MIEIKIELDISKWKSYTNDKYNFINSFNF